MQADIDASLTSLPAAEARVGRWILAHPRETLRASVRALATAAGTSEPTVIRFCRRLGLPGYRELKLRLAADLSRPTSAMHRDVEATDTLSDAVGKVLDQSIAALIELRDDSATLPFAAAVDALAAARQVVFVGEGASGRVAEDVWHKFFRLGRPSVYATDGPTIRQLAAVCTPADVLVAISHSGESTTSIAAASLGRARGATTIAVSKRGSPLIEAVDIGFACSADEDTSVFTPMSSRLTQLAVFDALHVALALALGESAETALRQSKAALTGSRLPSVE
ncbi:MAG: MurR/RpiR family transcriptional regulator [Pseudomonadota bacterium]